MCVSRKTLGRAVVLIVLLGLAVFFFAFDLGRFLTLEYARASQETFNAYYTDNAIVVIAGFMLLYIAVAALSLPGAAALTIAGGALLGLVNGTIAVSFASTIGATLACAASRFVLRDWVQGRFGGRLAAINRGVEREGRFYLFTLRLIPLFPFFVINLLMGLTRLPLRSFYWVSQVGMLPGTIVYVNAGRELAKLESFSGILSPGLIISFALLGLFPITAKKLLGLYRKKQGLETHLEGGKNG
ncbi:MAG: TVP38/TMEM64 family protein [Thermodesulfovibrionales bacterium]|nr:TVP38/TMEM64 family protein [Thermodesulfovibrionales bacterium]